MLERCRRKARSSATIRHFIEDGYMKSMIKRGESFLTEFRYLSWWHQSIGLPNHLNIKWLFFIILIFSDYLLLDWQLFHNERSIQKRQLEGPQRSTLLFITHRMQKRWTQLKSWVWAMGLLGTRELDASTASGGRGCSVDLHGFLQRRRTELQFAIYHTRM